MLFAGGGIHLTSVPLQQASLITFITDHVGYTIGSERFDTLKMNTKPIYQLRYRAIYVI